jgi:LysR family glycine cleavage system transcriptional activator
LQAFEVAARTGSFVSAAGELSVSPAAVSQLIRTLEEQIGRKLFHRINRRTVLTEAGREIHPRLMTAFEELRAVSMDLAGIERRSRLVLSVPPSMAAGWLPSRLAGFLAQNGLVDISLRGEEDPVSMERDLIDIRLSYGPTHYSGHETLEIETDSVYPVCSPDYFAKSAPVMSLEELLSFPLIHTDWGPAAAVFPTWRNWLKSLRPQLAKDIHKGMTANSSRAALDLAVNGLGVTLGQGIYSADLIAKNHLVIPVLHALKLSQPYCITVPPRSIRRPVVIAFRAWLAAQCRQAIRSPVLRPAQASYPEVSLKQRCESI